MPTKPFIDRFLHPDLKLLMVGGKGGVGKTTVAASLALGLSAKNKTLLISTDPAHSLADCFDAKMQTDNRLHPISPQLDLLEIDAEQALSNFKEIYGEQLKQLFDSSSYLDQEDIDQFLSLSIPGIDEVMGFKIIQDYASGQEYEKIVVDTAPTGHALRLLSFPQLLDEWIKVLAATRWKYRYMQKTFSGKYQADDADDLLMYLKRLVKRIDRLLKDGTACRFVAVGRPSRMVVNESLRLVKQISEAGIAVDSFIVNGTMLQPDDSPFCQELHQSQLPYLKQLKQTLSDTDLFTAPFLPYEMKEQKHILAFLNKIENYI